MKSVQIRSFKWSVFSRIWSEYGQEKTPYLDTFRILYKVLSLGIIIIQLIYRNNIMKFDESENKALSCNFLKKSRENYFCIIRKDWNFCDWILQAATILDKKLKIFIFIFFNLIFFSEIFPILKLTVRSETIFSK